MNFIRSFISRVETSPLTFWQAVLLIFILTFFRTFLENFANSQNLYHLSGIVDTFFHYPAGFSIVLLASILIAAWLTKEKIVLVAKFIALCSFGLVVPPILDLVINGGNQIPYIFISGTWEELWHSFLTYFGGNIIGLGIKIEIGAAIFALAVYIFSKTKNLWKAVIGGILFYTVVFVFLSTPAIIFSLNNALTGNYSSMNLYNIADFFYRQDPLSSLTSSRTFILEQDLDNYPLAKNIQNHYSLTLAMVFLTIQSMLMFAFYYWHSPRAFKATLKNFRYLRIMHNLILISFGVYLSANMLNRIPINSFFDFMSFVSLFLAFIFAWLFAVWENDEADIEIDRISNPSRPLVGEISDIPKTEWNILKYLFLFYALGFAFLCGLYTFVFILLFIFVYHIYSKPPLRLKKYFGISSALIAINSLLPIWMGFFLGAGTEELNIFPVKYAFGILIIFFLVENAKNIKDIDGDKARGIKTLPVLFGDTLGKKIIGGMMFIGSVLVPIIFYLRPATLIASIIFGAALFWLTIQKNYKEKYLFWVYFAYVLTFFLIINW